MATLSERIRGRAEAGRTPGGTAFMGIGTEAVAELAGAEGHEAVERAGRTTIREVEIAALKDGVIPLRYIRNFQAIGREDQIRLLESGALIVGCGGLGGTVVEVLARTGVGRLILMDGDVFDDSNLNRQLLSAPDLLGRPKAAVAAERVARINPAVSAAARVEWLTAENAGRLMNGADRVDVVVDCLDNLEGRFVLADAAAAAGTPMVTAGVAGAAGFVATLFPGDDPERIYGPRTAVSEPRAEADLGCLAGGVAAVAAMEAFEAVKALIGRGALLRDRMLVVDLMGNFMEIVAL